VNPKQLANLTAKWKAKLKRSGFRDIEDGKGRLRVYDSFYFHAEYSPVAFQARETYYRLASALLHTHTFSNSRQRKVWALHCEGKTIQVIGKKLGIRHQRVSEILSDVAAHIKGQK
jgi:hypothetical protein